MQFTLEMHVAARNRKKFTKTPYFEGSRSFKVIDVDIPKKNSSLVLVMISSMSVPIYNHFYVRRANNGKITPFYSGCPYFSPSFVGTPFIQWHKILSQNNKRL